MTPERQKALDKIVKLLALAAGTTYPAERDSAIEAAQRLMHEHDIKELGSKNRTALVFELYRRQFPDRPTISKWEFLLLEALALMCGVALYRKFDAEQDEITGAWFCGTVVAVEDCHYYAASINRQRQFAWIDYRARGGQDSFPRFCYGWATSASNAVEQAVAAIRDQQQDKINKAIAWREALHPSTGKRTRINLGRHATSTDGLEAGRRVSLHRGQLERSTAPTQIAAPLKRITHDRSKS